MDVPEKGVGEHTQRGSGHVPILQADPKQGEGHCTYPGRGGDVRGLYGDTKAEVQGAHLL